MMRHRLIPLGPVCGSGARQSSARLRLLRDWNVIANSLILRALPLLGTRNGSIAITNNIFFLLSFFHSLICPFCARRLSRGSKANSRANKLDFAVGVRCFVFDIHFPFDSLSPKCVPLRDHEPCLSLLLLPSSRLPKLNLAFTVSYWLIIF